MKRFKPLILVTAFLMLFSMSGMASAITSSERDELNKATPGTQKVGLGTKVRSLLADGIIILLTGDTSAATVQVLNLSVEPSGDTGYVRKFTGGVGGDSVALGDGRVGQILTLALVSDGGKNWTITPDTSSGFKAITFEDAGDVATIRFVNSTIGWVVVGTADVTAGPVLTAPDGTSTPGFK